MAKELKIELEMKRKEWVWERESSRLWASRVRTKMEILMRAEQRGNV
jgi:hypothetical protein